MDNERREYIRELFYQEANDPESQEWRDELTPEELDFVEQLDDRYESGVLAMCSAIGECTITAYCPCEECCGKWADGLTATGLPAGPGIVAVDPEVIELGSTVIIDGQRYLAADDPPGEGDTKHEIA